MDRLCVVRYNVRYDAQPQGWARNGMHTCEGCVPFPLVLSGVRFNSERARETDAGVRCAHHVGVHRKFRIRRPFLQEVVHAERFRTRGQIVVRRIK